MNAYSRKTVPQSTSDQASFDGYARQHPNKDPEQLLHDFVDTIRGGFEKGYAEAAKILEGLGVMGARSGGLGDRQDL